MLSESYIEFVWNRMQYIEYINHEQSRNINLNLDLHM